MSSHYEAMSNLLKDKIFISEYKDVSSYYGGCLNRADFYYLCGTEYYYSVKSGAWFAVKDCTYKWIGPLENLLCEIDKKDYVKNLILFHLNDFNNLFYSSFPHAPY